MLTTDGFKPYLEAVEGAFGCDVDYARQLGADLAITGVVQKVSALILNMNIYLRDTHTGQLITGMSADFRGNTDESWSRTMNYLLKNRLLAPELADFLDKFEKLRLLLIEIPGQPG